jgi:ribosomal protein L37E
MISWRICSDSDKIATTVRHRPEIPEVFMSLINCLKCGHAISNQAAACPHCGYSITEKSSGPGGVSKQLNQKKVGVMVACILVGLLCIMGAISLVLVMTNASAAKEAKDFLEKLKHEKLEPPG